MTTMTRGGSVFCDCATSRLSWASFSLSFDHTNPPFVSSVAHTSTRLQKSSVTVKNVAAGGLQRVKTRGRAEGTRFAH